MPTPNPFQAFEEKVQAQNALKKKNTLIYGPPRGGKTHFLGTAGQDPRTSPMFLLDFDEGSETVEGAPGVVPYRVSSWKDYSEAYDYLSRANHPFRSVGIDSLTETHIYSLLYVVDAELKKSSDRKDRNEIYQSDYGKSLTMMRRFLREYRQLPLHVFLTAWAKKEVEAGEGTVRKPNLSGTLADEVLGMFSVVGYLSLDKIKDRTGKTIGLKRSLKLNGVPGVRSGTRSSWGVTLPDELVDPTVTKLFDLLGVPLPE